jgi:hypothetical protein
VETSVQLSKGKTLKEALVVQLRPRNVDEFEVAEWSEVTVEQQSDLPLIEGLSSKLLQVPIPKLSSKTQRSSHKCTSILILPLSSFAFARS